jgi:uncharacterized protein
VKYLILFAVLGVVLWWLKTQRRESNNTQNDASQPNKAQHMVRCGHCDLHLPQSDAQEGSLGFYCSAAHRDAKEG